jgi:hypothetical protein
VSRDLPHLGDDADRARLGAWPHSSHATNPEDENAMNGKPGGHRPRLGWLGAMLAILGIVVLAACGSGGTSSASGDGSTSTAYQKALAYAQCIRAHGIPDYPDPNSQGQFVIQNGASAPPSVSAAVANAATTACQKLLPPSMALGPSKAPAGSNTQGLKFSECMRSHGEPTFPDPAANGSFKLPPGMDAESPQFQNAANACQSLRPNNPGGGTAS